MMSTQPGAAFFARAIALVFVLGCVISGYGQVNEPAQTPVYRYLYRMAQKGRVEWNDYSLPLDRRAVHAALTKLAADSLALSVREQKELRFYAQEYAFDSLNADAPETAYLFRKDAAGRFRTALYENGAGKIFLDPVAGASFFRSRGKEVRYTFAGLRLGAYFGKHWGVHFFFRDNTEKGDTLDRDRRFSSEEGFVTTGSNNQMINYSNLSFNLGYRWRNGLVSVGKESLSWGYGLAGNIALSGKAPSYPFVRLDYRPWRWLHFTYFHGWLQSNVLDSVQSYGTGSGIVDSRRDVYRPKFLAHHAVVIKPFKGLDLGLGESMVYSDRLNLGYLIPVSFFRAFDHYYSAYNIKAGDNSQFFGFVSSRNQLKNTHLYGQLFIDEIRISRVFNKREKRNQLGYTLGANKTDLLVPYLTVGLEYSRINPFVYNNLIPTQTYESHSVALGDWMGSNADRWYAFAQHNPLPRLTARAWLQRVRKGAPGTLWQQYFQQPQPSFLFQKLFDFSEAGFSAHYEWVNRLVLSLRITRSTLTYANAAGQPARSFRLGFSYGL